MLVRGSLRFLEAKVLFRPVNDRGRGDMLVVFSFKPVLDVALIVTPEQYVGILDRVFTNCQLVQDSCLDPFVYVTRLRSPLVL